MRKKNFAVDSRYIPNRSGVYVVYDEAGQVHDVGESARVGTRIKRHDRRACWQRTASGDLRVRVVWTPRARKASRRSVERELRVALDPTCGER